MADKTHLVAIYKNKLVGTISKVSDIQLAKLRNDKLEQEQLDLKEKNELLARIDKLEEIVKELKHEINVLKGEE